MNEVSDVRHNVQLAIRNPARESSLFVQSGDVIALGDDEESTAGKGVRKFTDIMLH
jgi:hypothetical protein